MARILVIDDETMNREVLKGMLSAAGHDTEEAVNGQEGVNMYRQNPPDLVITDLMMPQKDGLTVIKELRQDYPNAKIIAMAAGGQEILSRAIEMGADLTLEKPFHMKDLIELVNSAL